MRRLRLPQKFLVIALVLLVPLAFIGVGYLQETQSEIDRTVRERQGVDYLGPATDLLVAITVARSSAISDPAAPDTAPLTVAVAAVDRVDDRLGGSLGTGRLWTSLRRDLAAIRTDPPTDPAQAQEAWSGLAMRSIGLIRHAADHSHLTLTPDLDTHYLELTLSDELPGLIEVATRAADMSTRPGDDAAGELAIARGLARSRLDAVVDGLAIAKDGGDADADAALAGPLRRLRGSMEDLQNEAQLSPVLPQPAGAVLGGAREDAVALRDAVEERLDDLLGAKVNELRRNQRSLALTTAGALAVALWLFVGFYRSVRRSVDDLVQVLSGVAAGDLGRLPSVDSRDELGAVAAALIGPIQRMGRAVDSLRDSEHRLRAVVTNLPVVVFALDRRGVFTLCEGQALAGSELQQAASIVGTSAFELYGDLPGATDALRRALAGETVHELMEVGDEAFDVVLAPLQDPGGALNGVIGVAADVTERHRAQQRLDLLHRVTAAVSAADDVESAFAAVLADMGEVAGAAHADAWAPAPTGDVLVPRGCWSVDDGLGQFSRATELLSLPRGHGLAGQVWREGRTRWLADLVEASDAELPRRQAALQAGLRSAVAAPVRTAEGTVAVIELLFRRPRARDERLVSLLDDVARQLGSLIQRKQAAAALAHRATHDELTGLPNRALFLDHLALALSRLSRRPVPTAVMFLDLDHFKVVNDSLGHAAGDDVLVSVAERLQRALRPGDTAARFGGDEFTVLCEDLADGEAALVARQLTSALEVPLVVGGHELRIDVSIGIAVCHEAGCTPADLLRDADAALYVAKDRGRARQVVFDETMRARSLARLELVPALRRAIAADELVLHYQPEVDVASGAVVGAEALVRWLDPRRGNVPPATFIPLAEDSGLIGPLGAWVLTEAGRQLAAWRQRATVGADFVLAVNVSGRQLADPGFADLVARTLAATGVGAAQICLEITESVLMEDAEASVAALCRLRDVGVRLAIDDFGTGYSSLSYLRQFPVDLLKVDRSFVRGLGRRGPDGALGRAIVRLAHTVGLAAVAEGVETDDQLGELQRLRCELAQGYLFSPPLAADDFAEFVAARRPLAIAARA